MLKNKVNKIFFEVGKAVTISLVIIALASCSKENTGTNQKKMEIAVTKENKNNLTELQKINYALGYIVGKQASGEFEGSVDLDYIFHGIKAGLSEQEVFNPEEIRKIVEDFRAKKTKTDKITQEKASNEFLATYKKDSKVKTLKANKEVLYKELKVGTGKAYNKQKEVKVHYRGKLVNGTEFDSSYKRGEPIVFNIDSTIPGWSLSVKEMVEGDKWEVVVPPEQGYGDTGIPGVIPANAYLVFEIELIEFISAEKEEKKTKEEKKKVN